MSTEALTARFISVPLLSLIVSLVFHGFFAIVLLTGLIKRVALPGTQKKIETKQIYQSFIQVDVVELPDELVANLKDVDTSQPIVEKPAATPGPVPQAKQEDITVPDEKAKETVKKEAKKEAEDIALKKKLAKEQLLKEQKEALKRLDAEAKREAAIKALTEKGGQSGRGKIKGNILSKGTALKGAIGAEKDRWGGLVKQAIERNWNIYPWQRKKKLTAVLHLALFPTGRVRQIQIQQSSGERTYDSAMLQAVELAQPLPLPEDPALINEPLIIEFKAEE